jgi:proton-translocating NADH-quinone oxidoreductase chain N
MWLITVLEIEFVAAMLCLAADYGRKFYHEWRPYIVGSISTGSFVISLVYLLLYWQSYDGSVVPPIQPTSSPFASLYLVNNFTIFVLFTAFVIGITVSVYSWRFLSEEDNAGPFFALLVLLLTSVVGVVSSGDFLTLFLFWEGMSISAYGLVAFHKETMQISLEASLKYIFLAGTGSLLALYGISLVYSTTGSIVLTNLGSLLIGNPTVGLLALTMIMLGFGVEAAIFPLHTWLPDVYSAAPVPVSAFISGIVTETGVFVLLKVIQPLSTTSLSTNVDAFLRLTSNQEIPAILAVLATLTMLAGNLGGLVQTNLKRILSFSSIAQMGYIIAALSTFSFLGLTAVAFMIWNHGIVKSGFFMMTGLKGKSYEDSELDKLQGAGRKNKTLGILFSSSSLAMVGSPPFGMFWSELFIVEALLAASTEIFIALAVIVVVNIFLSLGYYLRIINKVVLNGPLGNNVEDTAKERVSLGLLIPPIGLIALSLFTGLFPYVLLNRLII